LGEDPILSRVEAGGFHRHGHVDGAVQVDVAGRSHGTWIGGVLLLPPQHPRQPQVYHERGNDDERH
jgi:hypothetical protein